MIRLAFLPVRGFEESRLAVSLSRDFFGAYKRKIGGIDAGR